MKILHVIPWFSPKRGGDVNVCYHISQQLLQKGHKVTIITTDYDYDSAYAKGLEDIGVEILKFPVFLSIGLFILTPSMRVWLKANITNYDIIHLHDLRTYQNILAYTYSRKAKKPYVIQPHASTPRLGSKRWLKILFDLFYGYKIMSAAKQIIAVSKEEFNYDVEMGVPKERVSLIYNGMDILSYRSLPNKGYFKEKYNINGRFILYLGRINETKGLDFLIRSYSQLISTDDIFDDVMLVIAGSDDGYLSNVRKLIQQLGLQSRVKIIGYLQESEKVNAYVDADIFVHTVKYMGGVGIAPLEAILCHTPIIVTMECGEIIEQANCGNIVDYNNTEELAKTIKRVLEDKNSEKERVQRGIEYIKKNLEWDCVSNEIIQMYEMIKNGDEE